MFNLPISAECQDGECNPTTCLVERGQARVGGLTVAVQDTVENWGE